LSCNALITSDDFIENHPDAVAAFLRGLAKGTLFVQTNPEAAMHIFYSQFPHAKPQDRDEETIMREAMHVLRAENVQRSNRNRPVQNPDGLWGFVVADEILAAQDVHYLMGTLSIKRPADYFMTNKFNEAINDFDAEAVIRQAREFTF
jgi:NitT/TauT family transport system substrate-binding protein